MPGNPFPLTPVAVCRPALPLDTPAILKLASRIWEGHDYLPSVWEDWLKDPVGLLAVAEYAGRTAGCGKLSRLSASDWWVEGLRVDPDLQGGGIGQHILGYLLACWRETGSGVIRLATNTANLPVHHMCAHFGFRRTGELTRYQASNLQAGASLALPFQPLSPSDAGRAFGLAQASTARRLAPALLDLGWQWAAPSPALLAQAAAEARAWWWRDGAGLVTVWLDPEETEPFACLGWLACPAELIGACLLDFRRLAGSLGCKQAGWVTTLEPELLEILHAAGYERAWGDEALLIYEKDFS